MAQATLGISNTLDEGEEGDDSHAGYFLIVCSSFVRIKYTDVLRFTNHKLKKLVR